MKTAQQGFTLIELVMVIVILGILAATALPKFIDLSEQAEVAAMEGIAGALSSASTINYAARKAGNTTDTYATAGIACNVLAPQLLDQYDTSVTFSTNNVSSSEGTVTDCTITKSGVTGSAIAKVISVN